MMPIGPILQPRGSHEIAAIQYLWQNQQLATERQRMKTEIVLITGMTLQVTVQCQSLLNGQAWPVTSSVPQSA